VNEDKHASLGWIDKVKSSWSLCILWDWWYMLRWFVHFSGGSVIIVRHTPVRLAAGDTFYFLLVKASD